MASSTTMDVKTALAQVAEATAAKKITPGAEQNIRAWLTETRYADYQGQVIEHIAAGKWKELDDVFWTVIPFGTGGRRGKMYPIGSNAINDRTIGESAQGLADYVKDHYPAGTPLSCAIAYDTRHRSRHFAELCSEIMVASGFKVCFLDGYRSTPELSLTVRHKQCHCGIMVTASHNPPSDNAVKAYWSTGGQLLPPHDQGVIDRVMSTNTIARAPFAEALKSGQVVYCQQELDEVYQRDILAQSVQGPRDLKIIYSPMHGVGAASVSPALAGAGFKEVEVFGPQAEPNGDFPNVPGHVSNPENPATFDAMIERAKLSGAEFILSTDPDADRLGCAAPLKSGSGTWKTFTGNQIGALLTDYLLESFKKAGRLTREHYVVKTLVTTEMTRRIADSYGVKTYGDLLVGFKWIAMTIDEQGPEKFVFGTEESHGFQAGTYTRDKDGTVAAMLMAELAAKLKAEGKTMHEKLDSLFWQHGCHQENTVSQTMPGSEGMANMMKLMALLRNHPPASVAGMKVKQMRDYENLQILVAGQAPKPLVGPKGDLVIMDLEAEGNYVAVRPSGTEPKVKFYMFTYEPAEMLANLETTKQELVDRLKAMQKDLFALAEKI